jgi:serine/threonine-protein kinase
VSWSSRNQHRRRPVLIDRCFDLAAVDDPAAMPLPSLPTMSGRWRRRLQAVVCASVVLIAASTASAQADTDALRRDLLAQADQAREAGDHVRAVEFAERAATLRMSPSLALLLAQEHEQLGHLVVALDHARRCTTEATGDPALRNRERLLGICRELTEVLSRRVGRLTVRVPSELAGATVRVGERELPSAAWGVAVPVDPGEVVVRVSDPRTHHEQRVTVSVAAGATAEVALTAPRQVVERPVVAAVLPPDATARDGLATRPARSPAEPARAGVGVGPWVVAGVGVAAFVGAGVLWAIHDGAMSDRDAACDADGCDPSSVDADARMRTLTTATNVAIGVGGAAVAGGVVWFLVGRTGGPEGERARMTAWVVPTSSGVAVGGVW